MQCIFVAMSKVLIIRLSSIGDIVLTSPVVRCLKSQSSEKIHITYLTKEIYGAIAQSNPNVDQVIFWRGSATIQKLKKENFDCVIDLHNNIRSLRIKKALSAQNSSFPKKNIQKWLLVNFKWDYMPDNHIVDRYFQAVKPLGIKNDGGGLEFKLNNDYSEVEQNISEEPFLCYAIGGQFSTKKLPQAKINELISQLELPVYLLGGEEDREIGAELESKNENVTNFCGDLSLEASAYVIKRSKVLITHDTGLMHIGAALNKYMVTIWGNTVPAFGMFPYMPNAQEKYVIHQVELSCRPCSKIGYSQCPKKHFKCMQNQDIHSIAKDVIHFYNKEI